MDKKTIAEELLRRVSRFQGTLRDDMLLFEDVGLNSLRLMEFIGLLEDRFDVIIPVDKVVHIRTIEDLFESVENVEKIAL